MGLSKYNVYITNGCKKQLDITYVKLITINQKPMLKIFINKYILYKEQNKPNVKATRLEKKKWTGGHRDFLGIP